MGLLSKATDCSAFPEVAGNCVHGSKPVLTVRIDARRVKNLNQGLSSDGTLPFGEENHFGQKEGP